VLVDDVHLDKASEGFRLSATVQSRSWRRRERLHFLVRGARPERVTPSADPFVPALLMPAMALGEELEIMAPVSRRLLYGARSAMDIYQAWWGLAPVPLRCIAGRATTAGGGVGLFFTAGVDSFYSLLKDLTRSRHVDHEPVMYLVYVNFKQHRGEPYQRLLDRLSDVAGELGKCLLVVETNVWALTEATVKWPEYHGAALASVAVALSGVLARCLIASTDHHGHLPPWGSHPLLDPLWSTEGLEVVHDGIEAPRLEKVTRFVASSPLAMRALSVCWRSSPDRNCGVCGKCVGTMIILELAGVLGQCATLPSTLDSAAIRNLRLEDWGERDTMRQLLVHARERERYDITEALEEALQQAPQDGIGGRVLGVTERLAEEPVNR
jgi:hypothetical protein